MERVIQFIFILLCSSRKTLSNDINFCLLNNESHANNKNMISVSLFLGLMEMFFYIAVYLFVASQWIRLSNLILVCCVVQEKALSNGM